VKTCEQSMKVQLYYEGIQDCVEVTDDPDGPDGIEIRYVDEHGKIHARVTVYEDQYVAFMGAMQSVHDFIQKRKALEAK
jgi:hypothetical protein